MIKFFRKIRQNMLTENRISKYLLYATGEIILVIIGILLAVQINNWNEASKIETDLNNSLQNMIGEINENLRYLKYEQKSIQGRAEGIQSILNGTATLEQQKSALNIFAQDANSNPFNKVYELLKEEKKLQLIKDDSLIKNINRFYDYNLVGIDNFSNWHEGFVGDNIDPYILENIPMENFKIETETLDKLLKETKFRNILAYQKLLYESYVENSKYAIENAQNLKTKIKNYLEISD